MLIILSVGAFGAGFIDAVVGGGGLIQIPTMMNVFPKTALEIIFGTNKIASVVGTSSAAIQYGRRIRVPWRCALPAAVAAFIGSALGAKTLPHFHSDFLKPLIIVLLIVVAIYTYRKKQFGLAERATQLDRRDIISAILIGLTIGFYDGFFGPGTGSFLIFLFIHFIHFDFLKASATAKIVNVATNLAAIAYFSLATDLMWKIGMMMAMFNLAGAIIGSRTALKHGTQFVRHLFLIIVTVLIATQIYKLFTE